MSIFFFWGGGGGGGGNFIKYKNNIKNKKNAMNLQTLPLLHICKASLQFKINLSKPKPTKMSL